MWTATRHIGEEDDGGAGGSGGGAVGTSGRLLEGRVLTGYFRYQSRQTLVSDVVQDHELRVWYASGQPLPGSDGHPCIVLVVRNEGWGAHGTEQLGDVISLVAMHREGLTASIRINTGPDKLSIFRGECEVIEPDQYLRECFGVQGPVAITKRLVRMNRHLVVVFRELGPTVDQDQMRQPTRIRRCVGDRDRNSIVDCQQGKLLWRNPVSHCLEVPDHRGHRKIDRSSVRQTRSPGVVPGEAKCSCHRFHQVPEHLPLKLDVTQRWRGRDDQGRALTRSGVGDAHAVTGLHVLDARLHHSPPFRTTHTRTASPTPFSACSPRSSNRTPADVRASERTVSDTSTSPGAERPLIREAMLTAPP